MDMHTLRQLLDSHKHHGYDIGMKNSPADGGSKFSKHTWAITAEDDVCSWMGQMGVASVGMRGCGLTTTLHSSQPQSQARLMLPGLVYVSQPYGRARAHSRLLFQPKYYALAAVACVYKF